MPLRDLWVTTPDQIRDKQVQQIIAFAGEGKLLDGGRASDEFRTFLAHVPSELLSRYAAECLSDSFQNSGHALQDIVNEVGRRLGFSVTPGRYRGVSGQVGFDGLWSFPSGHAAVVEVKTTDAYRIDLNIIANYRHSLMAAGQIKESTSSILIIVGRQDTGDLEAQIRGSRHAWDIRVVSIEALLRLLSLKEELEGPVTVRRIHNILIPREFTRLDDIVELVFSTAEDVKQEDSPEEAVDEAMEQPGKEPDRGHEPKFIPVAFHEACIVRIQKKLQIPLVRESRATFISPDRSTAVICSVSREYDRGGDVTGYWFAFHPHQKQALNPISDGFVAFGCGSPAKLLLIPFHDFSSWLDGMNITDRDGRMYWHVHITHENGRFTLAQKKGLAKLDLTPYVVRESQV
jgi:hypothetical protein